MTTDNDRDAGTSRGGPLSKIDGPTALKYGKWALMGLGGLVLVKMVAGILLSPLGLLALAGAGGFAWWKFGRGTEAKPLDGAEPADVVARPTAAPASPPPAARPAERAPILLPPIAPEPVAEAETELDALSLPTPDAPKPPPVELPSFAKDELAEFDRMLAALDDE